jgi:hypothetical protein
MTKSPILSVVDARTAAREPTLYLLWLKERQATTFIEPGWQRLEARDGAVLFVHRAREVRALRERGVL